MRGLFCLLNYSCHQQTTKSLVQKPPIDDTDTAYSFDLSSPQDDSKDIDTVLEPLPTVHEMQGTLISHQSINRDVAPIRRREPVTLSRACPDRRRDVSVRGNRRRPLMRDAPATRPMRPTSSQDATIALSSSQPRRCAAFYRLSAVDRTRSLLEQPTNSLYSLALIGSMTGETMLPAGMHLHHNPFRHMEKRHPAGG